MPNFTQLLNSMITYLQSLGSKLTDFTPTSVLYQILAAVASVVDQIYFSISNAQNQATITTATGTGLDNKGADVAVTRKPATPATWYFSFNKNLVSASQISIPVGTVITTIPQSGQAPVTFTTNASSYLPAGTLSVIVAATCQTAGTVGNIAPGTQLLIGSPTPGIDGVSLPNLTNGTYGTDIETDAAYRVRLLGAFASKAQGTIAWYENTALSVTGVQSVKINPQGRGSGTVDIYIVGTNNSLPGAPLLSSVQAVIDAGRIITDDAKVFSPTGVMVNQTVNVKVASGYDPNVVGPLVQTAVTNYINNLGIGGGSAGVLYQSQVMAVALGITGVLNAYQPATPQSDITFSAYQLPQAGTVTINASL